MDDGLTGGCPCGHIRYVLKDLPLFTHACHCRWCQRETGSAFAWNTVIETDRVILLSGQPEAVTLPSASVKGQVICRCPRCWIALYSHYAGAGHLMAHLRVGTLDRPETQPQKAHIFTESAQPWLTLPPDVPAFPAFYSRKALWPAASLARLSALQPAIATWRRERD